MGVTGFLRAVLHSAGTEVDLRQYRDGIDVFARNPSTQKRRRRKRPLRIGVDVSHWIYKACHRFGTMLAEEKHLTNQGRYQLVEHQNERANNQQSAPQQDGAVNSETARKYVSLCVTFVIERLEALKNETNGEIIAVLDGETPPIKKKTTQKRSQARKENTAARDAPIDVELATRKDTEEGSDEMEAHLLERMKANRRAGAGGLYSNIVEELILGMRERKTTFLVAPYEADGQLAWMSKESFVDLVVTEDSDLLAQGGVCMMYKMNVSMTYQCADQPQPQSENNDKPQNKFSFVPRGLMLKKEDLGAVTVSKRPGVDVRLLDMSDAMLAVVCVAAESDYSHNLQGIGFVTACEIVQKCFLHQSRRPPLETVFQLLFQRTYDSRYKDDQSLQDEYKQQFLAALLMYRHPVVYCPLRQTNIVANLDQEDSELTQYSPYRTLLRSAKKRSKVIGDLVDGPTATLIAEGWVSPRTKKLYDSAKTDNRLPEAGKRLFGLKDQTQGRVQGADQSRREVNDEDSATDTPTKGKNDKNACPLPSFELNMPSSQKVRLISEDETQCTVGNHGLQTQEIQSPSAAGPNTQDSNSPANPQDHSNDEDNL